MNGKRLSPLTRAILIFVCIIAFFILVENFLGMASKFKKETIVKKEKEEIQKEYEQTEKYEQEVFVDKSIEKTVELFKAQDYEALFACLEPRYKLCMGFNNVEELKEYIKNNYGEPQSMSLIDFYNTSGRLICEVRVDLDGERVVKPLVVIPGENDDFTLMFDKINILKEFPKSIYAGDDTLKINLKYRMESDSIIAFAFEILNKTSNKIEGSLEDTYIFTTNHKKYYAINKEELSNIALAPNETKTLVLRVDISDGGFLEETSTEFIFKHSDGKERILSVLAPGIYDFY